MAQRVAVRPIVGGRHRTDGDDDGSEHGEEAPEHGARAVFLDDTVFKRHYWWLWFADASIDVATGQGTSTLARWFGRCLFSSSALTTGALVVVNFVRAVNLRALRVAGKATAAHMAAEGNCQLWSACALYLSTQLAVMASWAWRPSLRPVRLREVLAMLPRPLPHKTVHGINKAAKAGIIVIQAWFWAASVFVLFVGVAGMSDASARNVSRTFSALPVFEGLIAYEWVFLDLVLWIVATPFVMIAVVPSGCLSWIASAVVAQFQTHAGDELVRAVRPAWRSAGGAGGGGDHSSQAIATAPAGRGTLAASSTDTDAGTASEPAPALSAAGPAAALRDVFVTEVLDVVTTISNRMGMIGHVAATCAGVGSVFAVVQLGLGGPIGLYLTAVSGMLPMCLGFLACFAAVNNRMIKARRAASHIRLGPLLQQVVEQEDGTLDDAARSRGEGEAVGEAACAPARGPASGAAAGGLDNGRSAGGGPAVNAGLVRLMDETMTNFEAQLAAAAPFVGISLFRDSTQVFTYALAQSFAGALLSLFLLVSAR